MTRQEAKGLLSSFKDRLQSVKRFYLHLAGYLTANVSFFWLNVFEGPDGPVVLLPVTIWGLLLLYHAKQVFGRKGEKTKAWEERMIYELMHGEEMPEDKALLIQEAVRHLVALPDASVENLQKRIQNLEAIITSQQWEDLEREKEALLARLEPAGTGDKA